MAVDSQKLGLRALQNHNVSSSLQLEGVNDLEFVTGDDTLRPFGSNYECTFPIKHGIVEDWNAIEHLWQTCFYDKLQCNTENHPVLLTETPLNNPEH